MKFNSGRSKICISSVDSKFSFGKIDRVVAQALYWKPRSAGQVPVPPTSTTSLQSLVEEVASQMQNFIVQLRSWVLAVDVASKVNALYLKALEVVTTFELVAAVPKACAPMAPAYPC